MVTQDKHRQAVIGLFLQAASQGQPTAAGSSKLNNPTAVVTDRGKSLEKGVRPPPRPPRIIKCSFATSSRGKKQDEQSARLFCCCTAGLFGTFHQVALRMSSCSSDGRQAATNAFNLIRKKGLNLEATPPAARGQYRVGLTPAASGGQPRLL